ncbi:hypothetical protein [Pendulispora albinea]|uniref:Uncharacterized protein n=1 Tax=Pendulispora albinea TaxID=2741071 RepID=A0ABZ2LXG9_9BACT
MVRLFFSSTIAAALLLAAPMARANPTARLVYIRSAGAADCPDEDALRNAVAARLGYEPFRHMAPVTIVAQITRAQGLYKGDVKLLDDAGVERGRRAIAERTNRCEDVITAMALTVSIVIDPLSLTRPKPAPEGPVEVIAPEPPPPPPPEPEPAKPPPPRDPPPDDTKRSKVAPHAFLGGGVVGALGVAPSASLGIAGFIGMRTSALSFALEARNDLPASTAIEGGGRVSSHVTVGSVVGCAYLGPVFGCPFASVGRIEASSFEIAQPRSDTSMYSAVGARTGLELAMTRQMGLLASFEMALPLTRPAFRIDSQSVYKPPVLVGGLALGIVVHL